MANRLKVEFPKTQIDFYYMDLQYFGKNFEDFLSEVSSRINFIQSNPISVKTDDQSRPIVRYESLPDLGCKETDYDLVVLSNGICPAPENEELADIFNLDLDPSGFLHPLTTGTAGKAGIFSAGTSKRPMRIDECVEDASTVSNKVLHYLGVRI
jgi:heterodisulfide reductase subunit A-like polyferredoxin